MAEPDQDQNKSEKATPFKLAKAREKGVVARGTDLGFLLVLLSFIGFFWIQGAPIRVKLAVAARDALVAAPSVTSSSQAILVLAGQIIWSMMSPVLLLPGVAFLVVLAGEVMQTGPVFTTETLKLDFSRLNPSRAFKRLFSVRLAIETAKNLLKMAAYTGAIFIVLRYAWFVALPTITDAENLAAAIGTVILRLLLFFLAGAAAFAVIDQIIARNDFQKQMRMTRRDVSRELRDREGDPRLKRRRKQLHREFSKLSKGVRNMRDADLLITNPTHYAVALRYDATTMAAPLIVAQAQSHNAQRLRQLALLYGVSVIQNPPLARTLYRRGRFEKPIPEQFYREVAELYIGMRDRGRRQGRENP